MFEYIKLHQVSFFSKECHIPPTTENITKLFENLKSKNFIPTTIDEITITSEGQKQSLQLRFLVPDSGWEIDFEPSRILISLKRVPGKGICGAKDFINEVKDIMTKVLYAFPQKANRLAFITQGLLAQMPQDRLERIHSRLINPIDFFKNNPPVEWKIRNVNRINLKIGDNEELLNTVIDINRIQGNLLEDGKKQAFDRIEIGVDINTFHKNLTSRFSGNNLNQFLDQALDKAIIISNEIKGKIDE